MELRTLEYFVAVAEEGSFTRAAARCHVVQPAISQQILGLEKELGEPLFERLHRRVVLTRGGVALLPHARACLAAAAAAAVEFADRAGLLGGSLALGTVGGLEGTCVPGLLGEYYRRHPGVTVNLVGASSPSLLTGVRNGTLDAAVMAAPKEDLSKIIGTRVLQRDRIVAVLPAGARAADQPLTLDEVSKEPIITYSSDSGVHGFISEAFAENGLAFNVTYATNSVPLQLALVAENVGIGLAPSSSPALSANRRTIVVPLVPAISFQKVFAWRLDRRLGAPLRAFLEMWTELAEFMSEPYGDVP
ncbi:LysR family transcriptional regulator [Streptomyces albipurpureus]|uniref:LysR family transcriptional regulator n=1 Tax=Streptomyces albipurpureus TaxID=2897419 RepID=A0ABT0UMF7_9ACTN|nr:LysR family transcriptional regulator [Streptomyces sp. CWNU-1]MCM2389703.1 LysR family transcriptional regulator [Streptomyces sp. CWNU-1]